MSGPPRLLALVLTLAAIAGGAAAIGHATEAVPPAEAGAGPAMPGAHGASMTATAMSGQGQGAGGASMPGMSAMAPGADGTHLSVGGLALAPASELVTAGRLTTWRFRILDREGIPVRRFERDQTKLLHLILARADLTGYQHLHPTLAGDGTFSVALKLAHPGRYRAIADFTTGGERYVLGTTLIVPGAAASVPLPAEANSATTEGNLVSLNRPRQLKAGTETELTFRVSRGGRPVTDLQPYLGAYGHLVALHAGDLAYSHVHPISRDRATGAVTFHAELAKPGAYRLFLQFRAGNRVHTVAFTVTAFQ